MERMMNKKMKIFIICAVFVLIISCKIDATGKDLENSEQNERKTEQEVKKQVEGFLEILETKDLSKLDEKDTKEIEKQIQELTEKIDKLEGKKTFLKTYSEYEEKIKQIKEKLKDKKELEKKLKELEDSLKKKKGERKSALQEAKQKFEEYKKQVDTSTGKTQGDRSKNRGGVGVQAWQCANELGLGVSYSNGGSDNSNTDELANKVIDDSLKKIEEELKGIEEDKKE
ncbi:ErpL protein [Borreliella burgdorferi]|nr:ErpL protein [Borreliella burgdorferi]MCS2182295.1 ErpL protein [Borreliella burgdorferi]